jgi:hypothetical protein
MRRRTTPVKHAVPSARKRVAQGVQLAWAHDRDGRKVRAARLAPADRRGRAPFTCLGCGEELIPHLGRVRTPHFAHRAGSTCPLTAPETALHLDAKERLLALCADAFAGRRTVRALSRCPACRRVVPLDLSALGDRAEAEGAVGALRADVLLRAGGRPALAIEVLVTHAVEPEKEAALAAAGVPAVEVDAHEEWEREEAGGVDVVCARSLGFPPCPACHARTRAEAEVQKGGEAAEIAELEGYRARGLLGPSTAPVATPSARPAPRPKGDPGSPDSPLTATELAELESRFTCPDCGARSLERGVRIVRHACAPGARSSARPVAWRGYDGSLIALGWWQRGPATAGARSGRDRK